MKPLIIEKTKRSPEIILDINNNQFCISGDSYIENTLSFYKPVVNWIESLQQESAKSKSIESLEFNFNFNYFNSSTFKYLIQIIKKLKLLNDNGIKVSIIWQYDEDDEDMKNAGLDIYTICNINIPFKLNQRIGYIQSNIDDYFRDIEDII